MIPPGPLDTLLSYTVLLVLTYCPTCPYTPSFRDTVIGRPCVASLVIDTTVPSSFSDSIYITPIIYCSRYYVIAALRYCDTVSAAPRGDASVVLLGEHLHSLIRLCSSLRKGQLSAPYNWYICQLTPPTDCVPTPRSRARAREGRAITK